MGRDNVRIQSAALRRYQRAQIKLREITTPDDIHYLTAFGSAPDRLYKHMKSMGFMWDAKKSKWRLYKQLKEPIWYMHEED